MQEILNPKLSVIVIVYNLEKYVEECLDSVVNQTYKDMEIVVVNAQSTDGSTEICRRYAEKYPNITLVECENGGLGANRNEGMKHAKGRYLAFVDGDDVLDLDMYRQMMECVEEDNLDCLFCSFKRFYNDNVNDNSPTVVEEKICTSNNNMWKEFILPIIVNLESKLPTVGTMCFTIYRKEIIEKNKLFVRNTFDILGEDIYFNVEYLSCCERARVINRPLYYYRWRTRSISNSVPPHVLPAMVRFSKEITEIGVKNGVSREEMDRRFRVYLLVTSSSIYRKQAEVLSMGEFCKYVKKTLAENNLVLTYRKGELKNAIFQVKLYGFLMKYKLYWLLYILTGFYSRFILR